MRAEILILLFACAQVFAQPNLINPYRFAGFQSETLTYQSNILANSGTISASDLAAVDTFVVNAKVHGYWSSLIDCSPLAGDQTNAAVIKLVQGSGSNVRLTINGLTSANYTKADGWNNPANAWLDTTFSAVPVTNQGMAFWISKPMTNLASQERPMGHSSAPSGNEFDFYFLDYSNDPIMAHAVSLDQVASLPNNQYRYTPGVGLFGYTRTANNRLHLYQNGEPIVVNSSAAASTANNQPVTILGSYHNFSGGVPSTFSFINKPIGFYAIDSGIGTNLIASYYADVRDLMKAIGRTAQFNFPQQTFLIVGQSLAVAGGSGSLSSTAIITTNGNSKALYTGGLFNPAGNGTLYTPNKTRSTMFEYGSETGWRAFADHLYYLCTNNSYGASTNGTLLVNWAEGGQNYAYLKKTSSSTETINGVVNNIYGFSTNDLTMQQALQQSIYGQSLNVKGILVCHGESDAATTGYSNNIAEWSRDYQLDIPAITGQATPPPLFWMQSADLNWPTGGGSYPYAVKAMYDLHKNSAGSNILVSSRYHLIHQTDAVHLYNISYQRQGEYFAEAAYSKFFSRGYWEPLRPVSVTRSTSTITVTVTNITGTGMIKDTTLVTAADHDGFTYTNNDVSVPTITGVTLTGATTNQIQITLSGTPGTAGILRYAMNCTNVNSTGPTQGARGNIRDRYSGLGFITTSNMYNWMPAWEESVP